MHPFEIESCLVLFREYERQAHFVRSPARNACLAERSNLWLGAWGGARKEFALTCNGPTVQLPSPNKRQTQGRGADCTANSPLPAKQELHGVGLVSELATIQEWSGFVLPYCIKQGPNRALAFLRKTE